MLELVLDLFAGLDHDPGRGAGRRAGRLGGLLRRFLWRALRKRRRVGLRTGLGAEELVADDGHGQLGDLAQGLEGADAFDGHGLDPRHAAGVEEVIEGLDRDEVVEVPLVILEDEGDLQQVEVVLEAVAAQSVEALQVGVEERDLGVGDEDDAVGAVQHALAGGFVEHLARGGHQLEVDLEIADHPGPDGQEVEEIGPVGLGLEADELAPRGAVELIIDVAEVGRLAAQAGAIVDDLDGDRLRGVVNERHRKFNPI